MSLSYARSVILTKKLGVLVPIVSMSEPSLSLVENVKDPVYFKDLGFLNPFNSIFRTFDLS